MRRASSLRKTITERRRTRHQRKRERKTDQNNDPSRTHSWMMRTFGPPPAKMHREPSRTFSWMVRNVGPPPAPLPRTAPEKEWVIQRMASMSWMRQSQRRQSSADATGCETLPIPSLRPQPKPVAGDSRASQLRWLSGMEDALMRSFSSFSSRRSSRRSRPSQCVAEYGESSSGVAAEQQRCSSDVTIKLHDQTADAEAQAEAQAALAMLRRHEGNDNGSGSKDWSWWKSSFEDVGRASRTSRVSFRGDVEESAPRRDRSDTSFSDGRRNTVSADI